MPYLIQAREDDKQASLSFDMLNVKRVEYTQDQPPSGPVPEMPSHGPRDTFRRRTGNYDTTQLRIHWKTTIGGFAFVRGMFRAFIKIK